MKSIFRKFIPASLVLIFMVALSLNTSSAKNYEENENNRRRYFDAWGWQMGPDGPVLVRIVHCDWEGTDCIVGPIITPE
ncbi:hypothetical protein [Roseivirga sp.]|uniref:hypothetical protein n=1 Tax=Roseivirga sp. TaxID=1964215 RepID=UPI002B2779BD|nr:hypothetical protein [Roseivirga sp.]